MADGAFYVADGERLVPSELTRGPWDPDAQHAGPPAALLGRAVERCEAREDAQVGRITFEILGPVPLAPLRATARVVRPGRSVELLEASLEGPDGEVMRASAWRLRTAPVELEPEPPPDPPPPGPADGDVRDFFPVREEVGYHTAMEISFVTGGFLEPGPAMVWMRSRVPLIEGERTSPLQRLLIAADAGNGVSAALDWRRYLFINTDLSVHLKRVPEGDWVGLDAVTYPEPNGVGLADTVLWDERGRLGRAAQTLVVRSR
ncbi:MAG TPA: thioesterase family protein [Thermoleophilaceae bacterium]|nr:thioesterase family protein [Thermoleophilaceae bacterium]